MQLNDALCYVQWKETAKCADAATHSVCYWDSFSHATYTTPAASHNSEALCHACNLDFQSNEAPLSGFMQGDKIIKCVVLESELWGCCRR